MWSDGQSRLGTLTAILRTFCAAGIVSMLLVGRCHADADLRPHLDLRYGKSLYTGPNAGRFEPDTPSEEPSLGASVGLDAGPHWGVELVLDYVKTNLLDRGTSKLGDYSTTTALFQTRWRTALWRDRLFGYALLGGGAMLGEFSGREDFRFDGGGDDVVAIGVTGVGVDYFLVDNVAFSVEAKYQFGDQPSLRDGIGGSEELDLSAVNLTAGLRMYFDHWSDGPSRLHADARPPDDSRAMRGYFVVRLGEGFFTANGSASGLKPDPGTGILGAGGFGLNLTRHWGAEYVMEYSRAQLRVSGLGDISGYPIATGFLLARGRYPLADGRTVPYVVFGPGFGFGQEGDLDKPRSQSGFSAETEWSFAISAGVGVDYYVDENIALGIEVRDTALFDVDVYYAGRRQSLAMDYVSISGGVRIFFP